MDSWKDLAKKYENSFDEVEDSNNHNVLNPQIDKENVQKVNFYEVGDIFSTISSILGEIILPHPLISIRRQCQLSTDPFRLHWTPFTIIPIPFRLVSSQGFTSLWKGIGSTAGLYLSQTALENILHEVLRVPKRVTKYSSVKKISYSLLLKAISAAVIAPFYASALVESVKSDFVGGQVPIWNFLLEGFRRCTFIYPDPINRLLPIWRLVPVYVVYYVLHYLMQKAATFLAQSYVTEVDQFDPSAKSDRGNEVAHIEAVFNKYYNLAWSTVIGTFVADFMLYPLELILNRLCVQGTRVLIDNVNYSAIESSISTQGGTQKIMCAVVSGYSGFTDALQKLLDPSSGGVNQVKGVLGMGGMGVGVLYRGFGAVVLQVSIQLSVLMLVKWAVNNFFINNSGSRGSWRYRGSSNYESASHAAMQTGDSPFRRRKP